MQLKCNWQKKKLGRMLKCGLEAHPWQHSCDIQRVECRVSGGQISFTVLVKMKKKFEKNEEDCDSASHVCKRQRASEYII